MFNETETADLLQKVEQDLRNSYIPIIVFLVLMALIGIPGNVTAAAYFGFKRKKTSIETFIMALALIDLFNCMYIVIYIYELSVDMLISEVSFTCKVLYFLIHGGFSLSVLIVCAIAVDRFIKLYLPNEKHFNCTTARKISLGLAIFSVLYSSRDFLTYDSFVVNITISGVTVEGQMCMNVRNEDLQWAVTASHVIDLLFVSAVVLLLICTYGGIVYKLYTHRMKHMKGYKNNRLNLQENSNTSPESPSHDAQIISKSVPAPVKRTSDRHYIISAERNVTWMMFSASVALLVCFLPYFIVNLIKFQGKNIEFELSVEYSFAIGFAFVNSVSNPIIYCIFTPEYRQYIKSLFTRCIRKNSLLWHRARYAHTWNSPRI